MKIVCDDKIPFLRGVLEPYAEVVYLPGKEIEPRQLRDADALIVRTRTKCDAALLQDSSVKVIASATIGYDHIDTAWCESRGIAWKNAEGCNSASVEQYMASVLVNLALHYKLNLENLTLGIVGVGNVGSKVHRMASLLGMKVLLNDPPRQKLMGRTDMKNPCGNKLLRQYLMSETDMESQGKPNDFVSLDRIIEESDIISLHVPLTKDGAYPTYKLFDSKLIARLKAHQILINTSRGEVVDHEALKKALETQSIKAAVIDVWENEPNIDKALLGLTAITTPHIAGYSADGKAKGCSMSVNWVAEMLNLPLKDWFPSNIAPPKNSANLIIDADHKTPKNAVFEAILHNYDVMEDDRRLREQPELFEQLRENYPIRREFPAYTIKLKGGTPELRTCLQELGFKLSEL